MTDEQEVSDVVGTKFLRPLLINKSGDDENIFAGSRLCIETVSGQVGSAAEHAEWSKRRCREGTPLFVVLPAGRV